MTPIGTEIDGLSSRDFASPEVAEQCLAALRRHGVVVYRAAHVDDAHLVRFSKMLGEVVVPTLGGLADYPEISAVSLDPSKSKLAEYRRSTFFWHIDGAQDLVPQKASLLAAREVADEGGDTEFANTYAAYASLSDREKSDLDGLRVVHSLAASQLLVHPDPTADQRAGWDRVATREHPLVWRRSDGRASLLIGASADHVVGHRAEESSALLGRLLAWCTQPQFVLRHQWQVGDLVVWDNTGMLHRALPYDPASRRLLHRTTLLGEEAVA